MVPPDVNWAVDVRVDECAMSRFTICDNIRCMECKQGFMRRNLNVCKKLLHGFV